MKFLKYQFLSLRKVYILFLFIIINSNASGQVKSETQLWNTNTFAIQVIKDLNIEISEKNQYSYNTSSLNLKHGELWLKHKLTHWVEYGAGFRVISGKKETLWKKEQRFMVLLNLNKNIGKFELNLSNRFEHRNIKDSHNHIRYRELISLNSPQISLLNTFFFISEEAFLRIDNEKIHLYRIYGGIQTFNSNYFELKLFYAFEKSLQENHWKAGNILGLNLKLLFNYE